MNYVLLKYQVILKSKTTIFFSSSSWLQQWSVITAVCSRKSKNLQPFLEFNTLMYNFWFSAHKKDVYTFYFHQFFFFFLKGFSESIQHNVFVCNFPYAAKKGFPNYKKIIKLFCKCNLFFLFQICLVFQILNNWSFIIPNNTKSCLSIYEQSGALVGAVSLLWV